MSSPSAITVGNFDGVHQGHAALVRQARQAVGAQGRVTVLTFDPHPLSVLRPDVTPARLSEFTKRRDMLLGLGVDEVHRLEPSREFLNRSPREFVAWLVQEHRPQVIVEGPDFRFGLSRQGSVQTLHELEPEFDFQTIVIEPVEQPLDDGTVVRISSSMLRWLIERGRVQEVRRLLGRPYELEGLVVEGDRRGRTIGVPTANLQPGECQNPGDGVYAGTAVLPDGTEHPAAISVGRKPTFDAPQRLCEAHLIGWDGPLDHYGWSLRVRFHHWMRDQVTFSGVEALTDQLQRDIARAQQCTPVTS